MHTAPPLQLTLLRKTPIGWIFEYTGEPAAIDDMEEALTTCAIRGIFETHPAPGGWFVNARGMDVFAEKFANFTEMVEGSHAETTH